MKAAWQEIYDVDWIKIDMEVVQGESWFWNKVVYIYFF